MKKWTCIIEIEDQDGASWTLDDIRDALALAWIPQNVIPRGGSISLKMKPPKGPVEYGYLEVS